MKDSSDETIAELFVKEIQIVVYGTTINKQTKLPMKRFFESESELAPFNNDVLRISSSVNYVAAWVSVVDAISD